MTRPDLAGVLARMDSSRRALGFLDLAGLTSLCERGIHILDPFSTLVSPGVEIEAGAVLHTNVTLELAGGGRISIGAQTRLSAGSHLTASGGLILVGSGAEIGDEGGFSVRAKAGETIEIGDRVRLTGGGSLSENCRIGDGAQILGRIDVRNCRLGAGGDYTSADPDARGAVLKGLGQARDIVLERGRVIQAFGLFSEAELRWQSFFHPRPDTPEACCGKGARMTLDDH